MEATKWLKPSGNFAQAGALASYGVTPGEVVGRLAYYVDRILRGAKPADLPVEEPTRLALTINLKTAGILGIKMPQSLLLQASELSSRGPSGPRRGGAAASANRRDVFVDPLPSERHRLLERLRVNGAQRLQRNRLLDQVVGTRED